MQTNSSDVVKKLKEELARQILIYFFHDKYKDSYLSDRPDIKNDKLNIGVEVTSSLAEDIHKKLSRTRRITGKIVLDDTDESLASFSHPGDVNDLIAAYENKVKSIQKEGYTIYEENNLYINSRIGDKNEIKKFIDYINDKDLKEPLDFNKVYIYTTTAYSKLTLIEINMKSLEMELHSLSESSRKKIVEKAKVNIKNSYYN